MSETHCPKCGKEVGSICIMADCPARPPAQPADPARIARLREMLADQSVSNDPIAAKLDALIAQAQQNREPRP